MKRVFILGIKGKNIARIDIMSWNLWKISFHKEIGTLDFLRFRITFPKYIKK